MRLCHVVVPWLVMWLWGLTPTATWANQEEPELDEQEAGDPTRDQAQVLYDRGKTRFEASRYEEAVEFWTRAYAILPETREYSSLKVFILYDLVTAFERTYETDHDPEHLHRAQVLLKQRRDWLARNPEADEGFDQEGTRIERRLADLEALFSPGSAEIRHVPTEPPTPVRTPKGPVVSRRRVRALIGTGSAALTLGVAGVAGLVTGLVVLSRDPEHGVADDLALAGGVVAGVSAVAGAVLLTVGVREKRRLRVALLPWGGATGVGSMVVTRF